MHLDHPALEFVNHLDDPSLKCGMYLYHPALEFGTSNSRIWFAL